MTWDGKDVPRVFNATACQEMLVFFKAKQENQLATLLLARVAVSVMDGNGVHVKHFLHQRTSVERIGMARLVPWNHVVVCSCSFDCTTTTKLLLMVW